MHTHKYIKQCSELAVAGGGGRMGEDLHAARFKMDNQQGPTVYGTGNSAQCHVAARWECSLEESR